MKTKEELNALKEEVKNLNEKLSALTEEELMQVIGGISPEVKKQEEHQRSSVNRKKRADAVRKRKY